MTLNKYGIGSCFVKTLGAGGEAYIRDINNGGEIVIIVKLNYFASDEVNGILLETLRTAMETYVNDINYH